ncbi:hypothetical protein ACUOII_24165, partial [Escherichia coli]
MYLLKITTGRHNKPKSLSLAVLFPGYKSKVFAHWFSGVLRCPQGKCTQYVHMGHESVFESDLFILVKKGKVIATQIKENQ